MARPSKSKHKPTKESRVRVGILAGLGVPEVQIAATLDPNLTLDQLRKLYHDDMMLGRAKASTQIANAFFKKCLEGDTQALIWYTKSRMLWRDETHIDHTSSDGSMNLAAQQAALLRYQEKKFPPPPDAAAAGDE